MRCRNANAASKMLNRGDSFYYGQLLLSTSDISDIMFDRLVEHGDGDAGGYV